MELDEEATMALLVRLDMAAGLALAAAVDEVARLGALRLGPVGASRRASPL